MNSILQCLSNTKSLRNYCLDKKYLDEKNPKSPLKGKLIAGQRHIIISGCVVATMSRFGDSKHGCRDFTLPVTSDSVLTSLSLFKT